MADKTLNLKKLLPVIGVVDTRMIAEVADALKELQRSGLSPASYDLSSPFEQQVRTEICDDDVLALRDLPSACAEVPKYKGAAPLFFLT